MLPQQLAWLPKPGRNPMTQQTPQALRPLPKKASPSHVHLLAPSPHQQVSLALGWEWGQHALSQAGRRLQLLGGGETHSQPKSSRGHGSPGVDRHRGLRPRPTSIWDPSGACQGLSGARGPPAEMSPTLQCVWGGPSAQGEHAGPL